MKIAVLPIVVLLLAPAAGAQTANPPLADIKKEIQIDVESPIKPEGAVPVSAEPAKK